MARELLDGEIVMEAIRVVIYHLFVEDRIGIKVRGMPSLDWRHAIVGKKCTTTHVGDDGRRMEAATRAQQKGRATVRLRDDWNARLVYRVLNLSPSLGAEALLMPLGPSRNSRPSVIPRPPSPAMGRWSIWAAAVENSYHVLPNSAVERYSAGFE